MFRVVCCRKLPKVGINNIITQSIYVITQLYTELHSIENTDATVVCDKGRMTMNYSDIARTPKQLEERLKILKNKIDWNFIWHFSIVRPLKLTHRRDRKFQEREKKGEKTCGNDTQSIMASGTLSQT